MQIVSHRLVLTMHIHDELSLSNLCGYKLAQEELEKLIAYDRQSMTGSYLHKIMKQDVTCDRCILAEFGNIAL